MSRIVYINGEFLPIEKASIPVMDRGFLFGDGVYDVAAVLNGNLVDNEAHLNRLQRSINELKINAKLELPKIIEAQKKLLSENNLTEGLIYLQVTRGTAERDFNYADDLTPNFIMFTQDRPILKNRGRAVKAITVPDIRWSRRDIKSTALLAQVIAKNEARAKGAFEAIMVDNDGFVTEGSSSNIFIVKNNELVTRALSNDILHGITRAAIIKLPKQTGLKIVERNFTVDELYSADECFMTSATTFAIGIVEVDSKPINKGQVGPNTAKLFDLYIETIDNHI